MNADNTSLDSSMAVVYKGHSVGQYFADLLVEDALVVELKCAERLASEHTAQCLNYLRASGRTVCLLVNFQKPKVEWKRVVLGFTDGLKAPGITSRSIGLSSYLLDTTLVTRTT